MQSTDYGMLNSPISPDASQYPDAVEVGSSGAVPSSWPAEARSSQAQNGDGSVTVSIGALTLDPARRNSAAASAPGAGQERRRSIDTNAPAQKTKKSVGWEPVSPGILDRSPEVQATRKGNDYYWPDAGAAASAAPNMDRRGSGSAAAGGAGPNLDRRGSKAAELHFPVAGLDGSLTQMTNRQFRDLLKSSLKAGDLSTARRLLTAPLPRSVGVVQMFLKRHKSGFFSTLHPSYECFLEEPSAPVFLMSSKKRTANKTSNYTVSLLPLATLEKSKSEACHTAEDPNFLGRLRSNFTGSEFVGFDAGVNPKDYIEATSTGGAAASGGGGGDARRRSSTTKLENIRQELCAITYENNVMSRCPRKFKVVVPGMLREDPSKRIVCRPLVPSDSLLYQYRQLLASEATDQPTLHEEQLEHQEILVMHNKEPVFEESINAWCLDFKGRAAIASVKNFQLVNFREDKLKHKKDSVVHLQFGKMEKHVFTMDVQYPLSIVQAFEISLAGLDTKLLCD